MEGKKRVALVGAVAVLAVMLGIASPSLSSSVSGVNNHVVQINSNAVQFSKASCNIQSTCVTLSCGQSVCANLTTVASNSTSSGNNTLRMWLVLNTGTSAFVYNCFIPWSVQTTWKNSEGAIVISWTIADNATLCQNDTA